MLEPTSPTRRSPREGAFTLIELLIVLGILAVLVAVVLPSVSGFLGRGQEEALNTDIRTIQTAVDGYYTDRTLRQQGVFIFPSSADGVSTGGRGPFYGWFTGSSTTYALITFDWLVEEGYLRSLPQSSANANRITPSTTAAGTYTWVIQGSSGKVLPCSDPSGVQPVSGGSTISSASACGGNSGDAISSGFSGGYP